jgi:hypothetical protein
VVLPASAIEEDEDDAGKWASELCVQSMYACFLQHRVEATYVAGTVVRTVFEPHTHTVDNRYTRGHAEDFHAASDAQRASWQSIKRRKRLMGTGQTASCKGGCCCIEASSVESTRGSRDGSMHSLYRGTR